ncbi:MAG: hypothetical protein V1707_03515 [bacterium]
MRLEHGSLDALKKELSRIIDWMAEKVYAALSEAVNKFKILFLVISKNN